ncbi:hypothetical protein AM501_28585 [Aneurinibacillus migulanus]|uniref:DUF2220 family protein n=1 Tax=Aneurinibacillus migulanus TaxID=47500 RepID=UPI0005BDC002|nr:DUF2220 family protein [Aneurinibacillus migulanus]KIV58378.1 hypothetical protein TS64_04795 [Aneurinibacillus migulanus]KPD05007.1 hypothetical protein AM501_28585 [Aneurinibacillus migulanus]
MSISENVMLSNKCQHNYRLRQKWEPFKKTGSHCQRYKIRWSECIFCCKRNFLQSHEREIYGTKGFYGKITDVIENYYQEHAKVLLTGLYKGNNNKHWNNWKNSLLKLYDYQTIMDTISQLHAYGILIKREEKDKDRATYWRITKVYYNEAFLEDIKLFIGISKNEEPHWIKRPFLDFSTKPSTKLGREIQIILLEQKRQYELTGKASIIGVHDVEVVSSSKSKKGYLKLIKILYGLYENVEHSYKMHWKRFSQRVFGDTKAISTNDKKRVELLLGKDLSSYGIIPERDEVIVSGDFTWNWHGFQGTSRAIMNYIPFPRDMIHEMNITSWRTPFLLIIENQDLFFSVVKQNLLDRTQWSILLGRGYITSKELYFIIQACKLCLKKVYVWPDIDPYGYQIAVDIARKVKNYNVSVNLFGYNKEWFRKSNVYKSLEPLDEKIIGDLLEKNDDLPKEVRDVLITMKKNNKKVEQEILIERLESKVLSDWIVKDSTKIAL